MAKQAGDIKITGTIEGLCFYRMEGRYYVRRKSTLTGRRFQRDAAFAGSRRSAGLLASASSLASRLYRRLPKERKARAVFQRLTGDVKLLLATGWSEERIARWFTKNYLPTTAPTPVTARKQKTSRCQVPRAMRRLKKRRFVREQSSSLRVRFRNGVGGGFDDCWCGRVFWRPSPHGEGD
jgi:hypothetical protein